MKGKTVLLVDDDHSILCYAAGAVLEAGYKALFANNGGEALRILQEIRPDLIFIEINTSKADGWNLCATMRGMPEGEGVPIILTSRSHAQEQHLRTIAEEQGADGWLMKPFGIDDLMRLVEEHLGGTAPQDEEEAGGSSAVDPEGIQSLLKGAMLEVPAADGLARHPVPLMLGRLLREGRSGLLYVGNPREKIVFYLEKGMPVCGRSTIPCYRLGEILLHSEKISQAQYDHARAMVADFAGARWLEEILVGLGYVTGDELAEALRQQLRGLLAYALHRTDGGCGFIEEEIPVPEESHVELDPLPLIFHAVKSIQDPRRILPHLPARTALLTKSGSAAKAADGLALTGCEMETLNLVDGVKSFGEIRAVGSRIVGNLETLVLAFVAAGLVEEARSHQLAGRGNRRPAWAATEGEAVLSGDLGRRPFASLLKELHQARKTGILMVERDGVRKWIHLKEGEIAFARSSLAEDRIGRVLVEAHLVPEAAVEEAAAESGPDKGRRIGGVLLDRGLVTFEQLYWAGIFQVQNIVQSLYSWDRGRFVFKARTLPAYANISLPVSTPNMLLEAMRSCRLESLERCQGLPADSVLWRPEVADRILETVKLSEIEKRILDGIGDEASLGEILKVGLGEESEVLRALHALRSAGLLERKKAGRRPLPPPPAPPSVPPAPSERRPRNTDAKPTRPSGSNTSVE